MRSIKPRVDLDEWMREKVNEYYTAKLGDEHLHKECFSHPDIDSHFCCATAPMHGGEICNYCGHDPDRVCRITCNIHKWCIAVYAWRLGIGDEGLYKAIKINMKKKYNILLEEIRAALEEDTKEEEEEKVNTVTTPVYNPEELDSLVGDAPEKLKEEMMEDPITQSTQETVDKEAEQLPEDLITIKEAAEYWPCTLPNIYAKIKSNLLDAYVVSGKKRVSKQAVEELRTSKRNKRNKK